MAYGEVITRLSATCKAMLPQKLKGRLGYVYKKKRFFNLLNKSFRNRVKYEDQGPIAPPQLIETEALMEREDLSTRAKPDWYFSSGYQEAWAILSVVGEQGFDISSLSSVLEFGCGSSRVLRHFRNISGLRVVGTDANPRPIAWGRQNLPGIEFFENGLEPPLSFAGNSFDLIYALSVFTHIPLEWQTAWLQELERVLRPGGYLLCTVHGNNYLSQLNQQELAALNLDGEVTIDANNPRASYSSKVLRSWDVFQTRDQVRERFGAFFDLLWYSEEPFSNGQDVLVLRKRRLN